MAGKSDKAKCREALRSIVAEFEEYLQHERAEGNRRIEADPRFVKGLSGMASNFVTTNAKSSDPEVLMEQIAGVVRTCTKCGLNETRTNAVPGQGTPRPEIMFIGEAPGADEDEQGLAFVGRAGKLLTKMIEAMGFTRDEVFIGNMLKCRPPDNRKPLPDEVAVCMPYLLEQISILKPRVIVALGATAVQSLMDVDTGITKLRGVWTTFAGIDMMPTFHPAYLLRNPPAKREVWDDLKTVLKHIGRPIPAPKK